jgi:hypothetical protein
MAGGPGYVGTELGRRLADKLSERGVPIYVMLLDQTIAWNGMSLVTKDEAEELVRLRSQVKQLESMLENQ